MINQFFCASIERVESRYRGFLHVRWCVWPLKLFQGRRRLARGQ